MLFFVNHSGPGRHPLHVTGSDAASVPRRIAVLNGAGIHDGHRFKAPVRMFIYAPLSITG